MKNINIIAELACIHEGDKKYIIDLAKECNINGANSIKFQCFDPEEVVIRGVVIPKTSWLSTLLTNSTPETILPH